MCSVCVIGVAGQGLGLVALPGCRREGERTPRNPDRCWFSSISDRPKGKPQVTASDCLTSVFVSHESFQYIITQSTV